MWGRCWEAGGAPAFWPWVQAVRTYVRDVRRRCRAPGARAQCGGSRASAAGAARSVRRPAGATFRSIRKTRGSGSSTRSHRSCVEPRHSGRCSSCSTTCTRLTPPLCCCSSSWPPRSGTHESARAGDVPGSASCDRRPDGCRARRCRPPCRPADLCYGGLLEAGDRVVHPADGSHVEPDASVVAAIRRRPREIHCSSARSSGCSRRLGGCASPRTRSTRLSIPETVKEVIGRRLVPALRRLPGDARARLGARSRVSAERGRETRGSYARRAAADVRRSDRRTRGR